MVLEVLEAEAVGLELDVLGLDGLALLDDRLDPGLELAGDEDTGHVAPVGLVDVLPHGFDAGDFPLERFSGSEDLLRELHFLGPHVLSDVTLALPEGLLDALVDSFLDVVVLLRDY